MYMYMYIYGTNNHITKWPNNINNNIPVTFPFGEKVMMGFYVQINQPSMRNYGGIGE